MKKTLRSIDTYVVLSFIFCLVVFLSIVASKDFALNNTHLEPTKQLAQVSSSLDNGLVAKWSFDEGSGTTASDSVGGNSGTLTGGPTWVAGKIGGALVLNGTSDYVSTVSTQNATAGASQKTISAWVNTNQKNGYATILSLHKTASAIALGLRSSATGSMWEGVYRMTGDSFATLSGGTVVQGGWQLVTLTQDGSNIVLYVNGTAVANATNAVVSSISNSCNVFIGAFGSCLTPANFFSGSIDDVRLYNRALSAQEVSDLYVLNSGSGGGGGSVSNPINGSCSSTLNSCTAGSFSDVTDSSTNYLWSCVGSNGGSTGSCSLPITSNPQSPINGVCATTLNTCTAGTFSDQTDSSTQYLWSCNGSNGGVAASCSSAIPSVPPTTSNTLPAPYNLRGWETHQDATNYSNEMRWDLAGSSSDIDGFKVQKSTDGINYIDVINTANYDEHYPIVIPNGSLVWVRIVSYKGNQISTPSNVMKFTSLIMPYDYKLTSDLSGNPRLTWRDITDDEDGFMIERSTDNLNWQTVTKGPSAQFFRSGTDNANDRFFVDTPGSGTYYYRLTAYNSVGSSPYPELYSIGVGQVPGAPSRVDFNLTQGSSNKITPTEVLIQIVDGSNNELGFTAEHSTDNVNWVKGGSVSYLANDKWIYDYGLTPGLTYYFRVYAYNDAGRSPYVYGKLNLPAIPPAGTTQWYVWDGATGSPTGASWANAWRSISEINWVAIKPGDTIYISGGNYDTMLVTNASGVAGNPVIIKTGAASPSPSGHDGRVTVRGIKFRSRYVTVDGSFNSNFIPQTTLDIIPNINMRVTNCSNTCVYSTDSVGLSVRFLEVDHNAPGFSGISLAGQGVADKNDIYGNYVHDVSQDGINFDTGIGAGFDSIKVRYNLVEMMNDDGMEVGGHATIHNNIIRKSAPAGGVGHPDGIVTKGDYLKIYNNTIGDLTHASGDITFETYGPTSGHWHVFNNLLYMSSLEIAKTGTTFQGIDIDGRSHLGNVVNFQNEQVWDDIVFANNTFVDLWTGTAINHSRRSPEVNRVRIKNMIVQNNLIYNVGGVDLNNTPISLKGDLAGSGIIFDTPSSLIVDHNVIAGISKKLEYKGVRYNSFEDFNNATGYRNNTSITPTFVNYVGDDFRLAASDTSARDKGADLSAYFNFDHDGNARPQGGTWDIGAFEAMGGGAPAVSTLGNGLVLNLDFNNDNFTTTQTDAYKTIRFADGSGNNNFADCQSAFALNNTTYNQCPVSAIGPDGSKAAQFTGPQTCDNGADYLAVQRAASLNQLSQGSISLWIASGDNANALYRVLDTYSVNTPHSWELHRDGDVYYTFSAYTDSGSERDLITFPGGSAATGWNLYTITWDGSVMKGYYNGVNFTSIPMTGISSLDLTKYLAIGALMHGDPRNASDGGNCVHQYGGTVGVNYVMPNAGYFSGKLDDIRIYNRPLNASEVSELASRSSSPSTQNILKVIKAGTGTGTVSGGGISCGKHCAESYTQNINASLTATADPDSVFSGWSGDCGGTGVCVVNMSSVRSVTATFTRTYAIDASFEAEAGTVTGTFVSSGGVLSQVQDSVLPAQGGKAVYRFNAPVAGNYIIRAKVNAPSSFSNSFYVSIDNEPTGEAQAWFIKTTGGLEDRFVSWGGNLDGSNNPAHIFTLTAGEHTIIIRGREGGTAIDSIAIERDGGNVTPTTPTPVPSTPDTTLPTITITSPQGGTTISGNVLLSSTAQDPTVAGQTTSGILGVQFKLDNINLGQELTTAPYSGTWNTLGVPNGNHTLIAVARDIAGNSKTSLPVTVTISNTATPVPTPTPLPPDATPTPISIYPTPTSIPPKIIITTPPVGTLTPTVTQKPVVTKTTTNNTKYTLTKSNTNSSLGTLIPDIQIPEVPLINEDNYKTLTFWDFIKSIFLNTLGLIKELPKRVWTTL